MSCNLTQIHHVKTLIAAGHTQEQVAKRLGLHRNTVSNIANGNTGKALRRIADRMAYFGMLDDTGNSRRIVHDKHGEPSLHDSDTLYCRELHHDDPLALLLADERFGNRNKCLHELPERIDTPQPEHIVTHEDTWEEYVYACGGEVPALSGNGEQGGKLATQGAYVSSWAVRDQRYEWGYPYRNTLNERLLVAALSVCRRRARARDGQNWLISQDLVLRASTSTSTKCGELEHSTRDKQRSCCKEL